MQANAIILADKQSSHVCFYYTPGCPFKIALLFSCPKVQRMLHHLANRIIRRISAAEWASVSYTNSSRSFPDIDPRAHLLDQAEAAIDAGTFCIWHY